MRNLTKIKVPVLPHLSMKKAYWIPLATILITNISFASSIESTLPSAYWVQNQQKIIGKVVHATTNEPIAGVTIKIKNKLEASSTDEQGNFEINASSGEILVISYLGYLDQEYTVSNATTIEIKLQEDINALEEVVVTGYGAQRKKDLTGSVAVVDVAQLKQTPAASAVESLQGRATGVQVVVDGAPGSTPQIKIRGYSTINNNEPLYVIDGVPFEGKLSWLNQNDIETMQVLKDASAASIYGSRANNGVVIITTKSGRSGKPQINFDAYYGIQNPRSSAFPDMLTPQQSIDMDNKARGTNVQLPEYLVAGSIIGNNITPSDVDMSKYNYLGKDRSTFYQITKANQAGTNWFEEVTQPAPTQSYQLSATGGGENATYAISGGYLNQKGTVIHSGFERFNVRSNSMISAFDKKLRFGQNMQYSFSRGYGFGVNPNTAGGYQSDGTVVSWSYRIQNIIPVYDEGGNFAGSLGGWGNGENPVAVAYRAKDNKNMNNFFFGNAFAEYDFIDGLTFRTNFGLRYENYNGVSFTYPNPEFTEGSFNNGMSEYFGYNNEWTWTNTINYKPKLGDNHSLNVLLGTEAIDNKFREIRGSRNGYFTMTSLDYLYLSAGTTNFGNAGTGSLGSLFSYFGKADYSYQDRYLLSLTVRRDGSSNFGPTNRYGTFPGISAAWRLSEEAFLLDTQWLNDLKLRAGYGITGNQRIPGYQYLSRYAPNVNTSSYPINGTVETGIWQTAYPNVDVRWEEVTSLNMGVDFSILQGDIDGSFDWYNKSTTDMLFRVPLLSTTVGGAQAPYQNIGEMNNKGLELSVGYHYGRRQNKDFTLDLTANISRNINEVVSLSPSTKEVIYGAVRNNTTSILRAGQPFGAFYGYNAIGIYQSADDVANSPSYVGARPGSLKYEDINKDGIIDAEDRTIIGSPHPDFIYSLNISGAYKKFDFSLYFYGSQGNDIYEGTRYFTDFGVFNGQKSARLLDSWSPENPNSMIPSIGGVDATDYELASSTYYIQDGSFLRLKNLQLGYNFDTKKLFNENSSVNKLRVYFGVTNLLTFTKYTGLDPEISALPSDYPALGVDLGIYPQSRQYMLGVSLGF